MGNLNVATNNRAPKCTWEQLKQDAAGTAVKERALASMLHAVILNQKSFADALANHLAEKLSDADFKALHIRETILEVYAADPGIIQAASDDLRAVRERDPASKSCLQVFLYFKGFLAIQTHRVAHALYKSGREMFSYHLQSRSSQLFAVDIHPAARIGSGLLFDHATGIVVGETAVIGDNCSILHGVTLGGTGKDDEDRHPKISDNVLIGAGAKVLGNIKVGEGSLVAAGSVVLEDVKAHCTVAGVPAKPIGGACCENPAREMNQILLDFSEG
ncbi:MAG: serine O-acetyltransferase [Robiginitomaculum sp.]